MKHRTLLLLACVVVAAVVIEAHHTVALTFDVSHTVALTGKVTSIQWQNPHVIYHLAVADGQGRVVDWEIESRHVDGMRRDGIQMDTIKVGDTVSMHDMVALDGSHRAATASVVLPDGRTVRICTVTNNACP